MKKTLIIDGGLGRCVSAIPALETFIENNADANIVTYAWTAIYWCNQKISGNIIDSSTKGLFEIIKNTKIIKPEPYYNIDFMNNKISMTSAFKIEINGKDDDIKPKLYFSKSEKINSLNWLKMNSVNIIYQPFGSSAKYINGHIIDESCRSLTLENAISIYENLVNAGFHVVIIDTKGVDFFEKCPNLNSLNFRSFSSVISCSDYFIGIDSCGQHIAHALEIPGTTFFGGTSAVNFGYADWFKIIQKNVHIKYPPFRICDFDVWLNNLENENLLDFSDEHIEKIVDVIIDDIKNKYQIEKDDNGQESKK